MALRVDGRRGAGRPPVQRWQPWWEYPDDSCYRTICQAIEECDQDADEQRRQRQHLKHMAQYDAERRVKVGKTIVNFNVTQSVIDTATAQIAGNRTAVMTLTKQGDSKLQRQAKRLNQFIEGQFDATGQTDLAKEVFQDAAITGTGIERGYICEDEVRAKVIDPLNLIVPACERSRQQVRQAFEAEPMPLYEAQELYPDFADELAACQPVRDYDRRDPVFNVNSAATGPLVYLYHAWITARTDEPEDEDCLGKHVVCIDNATLLVEPYRYRALPHSIYRWSRRPKSFWGLGICHRISNVQEELDELAWKIQDSMKLASTHVYIRKGSSIAKQAMTNRNLALFEVTGTAEPIVKTNAPIDGSYFAERDSWRLQRAAVSYLSTQPSGKVEEIQEMAAAFPQLSPFLISAIDFPDLQRFTSMATAPYDEVNRCLDSIMDDGVYMGPEPSTDLAIAGPLVLAAQRRARANNLEESRQDQLRTYSLALERLKKKAPGGADAAMAGGPPPGPEGMPPAGGPPGLPPGMPQ